MPVWSNGDPVNNPGDVARYSGNNTATFTLDTDVTIGVLRNAGAGGSGWTILSDTANSFETFTMDGTGLSAGDGTTGGLQDFGNAGVAAIVNNTGNASTTR